MKHDALTMALLYDYYGELLTEKQKTVIYKTFWEEKTLREIC